MELDGTANFQTDASDANPQGLPPDPLVYAEQLRQSVADAIPVGLALLAENELPQADESILAYENSLRQDRYTVLVCGEAKRGKSTFINALIGKSILPTDVDIATSQVFQIQAGDPEAYVVRYEDDSGLYIEADDLAYHGSQVAQDAQGYTAPDLTIRQLEITTPTAFLPPNVTLLDTPGLGSLYSGHAKITYRFVPQADAVIFVLDSNAPITQPELTFLGEILAVTPHVFFLQTRIDQVRQADWEQVLVRNTEVLRARYGKRLGANLAVWPVSSQMLLKAGQTGNPTLVEFSRFPPMLAALRRFLLEATGWDRTHRAVERLFRLQAENRPLLAERVEVLSRSAYGGSESWATPAGERLENFQTEWGAESRGRRAIEDRLRDLLDEYQSEFQSSIEPFAPLEREMQGKIDELSDIKDAELLASYLASEVTERVNMRWRLITRQAVQETAALLLPLCGVFHGDSALLHHLMQSEYFADRQERDGLTVRDNVGTRLRTTWQEAGLLMGAGAVVAAFIPVVGLPVAALAAGFGYLTSGGKLAAQAKPQLSQYLQTILSETRTYYTHSDAESGGVSRARQFFRELERAARRAMEQEYQRRVTELEREKERLVSLHAVADEEADARLEEAQIALQGWDDWGSRLSAFAEQLDRVAQMPFPIPVIKMPLPPAPDSEFELLPLPRSTEPRPTNDSEPIREPEDTFAEAEPEAEDTDAARESFRASVISAVATGRVGLVQLNELRLEAEERGLEFTVTDDLVREELQKARQSGLAALDRDVAMQHRARDIELFRRALVESIQSESAKNDRSVITQETLDALADAARLTHAEVRDLENEIRDEIRSAVQNNLVTPPTREFTPAERYAARFAELWPPGSKAITDTDQEQLDELADTLGLSRVETRAIEREIKSLL